MIGLATVSLSDSTFLLGVGLEFGGVKVLQNCLRNFEYLIICLIINSDRQVRYCSKVLISEVGNCVRIRNTFGCVPVDRGHNGYAKELWVQDG